MKFFFKMIEKKITDRKLLSRREWVKMRNEHLPLVEYIQKNWVAIWRPADWSRRAYGGPQSLGS